MFNKIFKRKDKEKQLIILALNEIAERLDKLEHITVAMSRILKIPTEQLEQERNNLEKNLKYVLDMTKDVKKKGKK